MFNSSINFYIYLAKHGVSDVLSLSQQSRTEETEMVKLIIGRTEVSTIFLQTLIEITRSNTQNFVVANNNKVEEC